jgi:hypothetical protein
VLLCLILGGGKRHPRQRLNPEQVVVYRLHTRHVLDQDLHRAAFPRVRDHARQVNHAITDHNVDIRGPTLPSKWSGPLGADS